MLILAITVLHKTFSDREMYEIKKNRSKTIDLVIEKIDAFSSGIERVSQDIAGHYQGFKETTETLEKNYRDITERVINIENRVHEVRKTLGAAVGSLEERMQDE